ncbi:MAG: lytic transglycosylase domain-containing protein [Cyanobacteria bacterium REEB65]|nr:lytic transglycosylase domain-containing protein [Cyanobacteria bacterium REEB65]
MVHTLVYLADRPIGMRRRLMPDLQVQAALLAIALAILALWVGLRGDPTHFRSVRHLWPTHHAALAGHVATRGAVIAPDSRRVTALRNPRVFSSPASAHMASAQSGARQGVWRRPPSYPYASLIRKVALRNGLSPDLIAGVVKIESQFNRRCVSPVGAEGLMQLMPSTAYLVARKLGWHHFNLFNPEDNLELGTYFLKSLLHNYGDIRTALSYYNAGRFGITSRGGFRNWRYIRAVLIEYHRFGAQSALVRLLWRQHVFADSHRWLRLSRSLAVPVDDSVEVSPVFRPQTATL